MPKENITSFNFRLNLDNEQHLRVYKVFHNLNVDIHKSKNLVVEYKWYKLKVDSSYL